MFLATFIKRLGCHLLPHRLFAIAAQKDSSLPFLRGAPKYMKRAQALNMGC